MVNVLAHVYKLLEKVSVAVSASYLIRVIVSVAGFPREVSSTEISREFKAPTNYCVFVYI